MLGIRCRDASNKHYDGTAIVSCRDKTEYATLSMA